MLGEQVLGPGCGGPDGWVVMDFTDVGDHPGPVGQDPVVVVRPEGIGDRTGSGHRQEPFERLGRRVENPSYEGFELLRRQLVESQVGLLRPGWPAQQDQNRNQQDGAMCHGTLRLERCPPKMAPVVKPASHQQLTAE